MLVIFFLFSFIFPLFGVAAFWWSCRWRAVSLQQRRGCAAMLPSDLRGAKRKQKTSPPPPPWPVGCRPLPTLCQLSLKTARTSDKIEIGIQYQLQNKIFLVPRLFPLIVVIHLLFQILFTIWPCSQPHCPEIPCGSWHVSVWCWEESPGEPESAAASPGQSASASE